MMFVIYGVVIVLSCTANAMQNSSDRTVLSLKQALSQCLYYYGPVLKKTPGSQSPNTYEFGYQDQTFYDNVHLYDQQDVLAKMLRTVYHLDHIDDKIAAYEEIRDEIHAGRLDKKALYMLAQAGHYQALCLILSYYDHNSDVQNTNGAKVVLAQVIESLRKQIDQELIRINKENSKNNNNSYKAKKNKNDRLHTLACHNLESLVASKGLSALKELIQKDPQSTINYIKLLVHLLPVGGQDHNSLGVWAIDECLRFFEHVDFSRVNTQTQDEMRIAQFETYSAKANSLLNTDCQQAVNYYAKIAVSDLSEIDPQFKDFFASLYLYAQGKINKEKIREIYGISIDWGSSKKSIKWGTIPVWVYYKIAGYYTGQKPLGLDQNYQEIFDWCKKIIECDQGTVSVKDHEMIAYAYTIMGDFYNPYKCPEKEVSLDAKNGNNKVKKKKNAQQECFNIEKDAQKAIAYYKQAIKYGGTSCKSYLAFLCFKASSDYALAKDLFYEVIQQGIMISHRNIDHWCLGQMALMGQGQPIDYKEAIEHFKLALENQDCLADMDNLIGISDRHLVDLIYVRARFAIRDNAVDQDSLYWCYLAGRLLDCSKKQKEAIEMLFYAHKHGHYLSQWYLVHRSIDYKNDPERTMTKKIEELFDLLKNDEVDSFTKKCLNATNVYYDDRRILDLLAYQLVELYEQNGSDIEIAFEKILCNLNHKMRSKENVEYLQLDFYEHYNVHNILVKGNLYDHIVALARDSWSAKVFYARILVSQGNYQQAQDLLIEAIELIGDLELKQVWLDYLNRMCAMVSHKYQKQGLYDVQGKLQKDTESLMRTFNLICRCYDYTKDPLVGAYKAIFIATQSDSNVLGLSHEPGFNTIKAMIDIAIQEILDQNIDVNSQDISDEWCHWAKYLLFEGVDLVANRYVYSKRFDEAITLLERVSKLEYFRQLADKKIDQIFHYKKLIKVKNSIVGTFLECHELYEKGKYDEAITLAESLVSKGGYEGVAFFFLEMHLYDNHPLAPACLVADHIIKTINYESKKTEPMIKLFNSNVQPLVEIERIIENGNFLSNVGRWDRAVALKKLLKEKGLEWKSV